MSQSRENGIRPTQDFTDEEITRRMNEALRRALTSPPKPHSEMKIGNRKAKAGAKANPKNGRRPRKVTAD
jgi:hypothetical protein